jgi:transcriptional regulator with XRE-family HTH domain
MAANRFKELREERKLSQRKLAELLGVSQGAVAQYETGRKEPGREVLEKYSSFFRCTVDYLLNRADYPGAIRLVGPEEMPERLKRQGYIGMFTTVENLHDRSIEELHRIALQALSIAEAKKKAQEQERDRNKSNRPCGSEQRED